jgi:hypothetical protein
MNDRNFGVIAAGVFTAPNAAFAALREQPTLLAPLLLLIASAIVTTFLYMSGVDIVWLFEQWLRQNPDASAEQIQRLDRLIRNIPQAGVAATLSCFAALGVGFVLMMQALYYKIISWITRDGVSYRHWFSMVAWCALPSLLSSLASIVNLLTGDAGTMPQDAVNPLSFANLAGIETTDEGVGSLLAGYDPMQIWSLGLLIFCYRTFSSRSLATSAGIVLLPTLVSITLTLAF